MFYKATCIHKYTVSLQISLIKSLQWVISVFPKTVHILTPKHASRPNSRNIIGRNPSMMMPLLAQLRFEAYAMWP